MYKVGNLDSCWTGTYGVLKWRGLRVMENINFENMILGDYKGYYNKLLRITFGAPYGDSI
jgi:hypothetical protein